ncbi:MAG: acyl-CoA dehydrogenase family protein [Cytophagaceae bacterium]|nr:acyl-CoA dehydrogenase family protein [Gemmatimonadaceae bacterium]
MPFPFTPRSDELVSRVRGFMQQHVHPNEARYRTEVASGPRWKVIPFIDELRALARAEGLWNLFLTHSARGPGLTNLEYARLAEVMGHVDWAPEVFNCAAPDTGNMEVLDRFGTPEQQSRWLDPLLAAEIRSAYAMTEPDVASSDATNVAMEIRRDGTDYVLNGRKWWATNAADARCRVLIVMGRSNPDAERHRQHSMILVPMDAPGLRVVRTLEVFGYDDAPHGHCELAFEDVRVPASHMILGEGRGFEIAQGRLGPGRIHHCMRSIGAAERAFGTMCERLKARTTFGKPIAEQSLWQARIADARCEIDMARLLVLQAARMMDTVGVKGAQKEIAMIKLVAPAMACRVIDLAIQAHGGGGLSPDFPLAAMYAGQRSLRIADGPDEVHQRTIARLELRGAGDR